MHGLRFDQWTRRTFGLVVGGGITSLLGLRLRDDAVAKKKRKRRKNKTKRCSAPCAECQRCQEGKCVDNNGAACGNHPCQECQGGLCGNAQNGTACNGAGKCVDGTCNPAPTCNPKGEPCTDSDEDFCCSASCTAPHGVCSTSGINEVCITDADCNTNPFGGLNFCNTSFRCQEPSIGG